MHQSGRKDPKLSEVRAVLHRLQGLPAEPQSAGSGPADPAFRRGYLIGIAGTVTVITAAAVVLAFGFAVPGLRPQTTSAPKGVPDPQLASSKVPDASGVLTGSAVSSEARPASSPAVRPAVEAAQALMSTGRETSAPKGVPDPQLASSKVPDASGILTGSAVSSEARPASSPTVRPAVEAAQALMSTGRVQAARQQLLAIASDGSPDVAWALARSYDPNHLKGVQGADAGPDVAEATRWYRTWYAAAVKQGMISDSVSLEKIVGSMRP